VPDGEVPKGWRLPEGWHLADSRPAIGARMKTRNSESAKDRVTSEAPQPNLV